MTTTDQDQAARLAALAARRSPQNDATSVPAGADPVAAPTAELRRSTAHAASGARWLVAGVSAAATLGMIGAMAASTAATADSGPETVTVVVARNDSIAASVAVSASGELAMAPDGTAETSAATPSYSVVSSTASAASTSGGS